MAADETHDLGFQQRSRSLLNCPSSTTYAAIQSQKAAGMTMSSTSMCESLNRVNSSLSSDWNPLALLVQNAEFKGSLPASHNQITSSAYSIGKVGSQLVGSASHLVQYPSDPCFVELVPRHQDFGSGSFSHTVTSFGLPDGDQIMDVSSPPAYSRINNKDGTERTTNSRNCNDHGTLLQVDCQRSDDGAMRHSPNGKKRKIVADGHSQLDAIQTAGRECQKDVQLENLECLEDQDEKKRKTKEIPDDSKQCKSSQNEEATKEDYIHVRARRGQATNNHSLAERVRREKISERMRFLQELVPGCSKITGKAVMLDEIINYVQSLQRQVEFLSMKLATVNPELSTDIERILSEDILHSGVGTSAILGFAPGMRSSHPHQVTPQGAIQSNQGTNPHFLPISQLPSVWDYELQSAFQMVLNPSPAIFSLEQDGSMKVER